MAHYQEARDHETSYWTGLLVIATAGKFVLVHPNQLPKKFKMDGLHLWSTPYVDDVLIRAVNRRECGVKLTNLQTDIYRSSSELFDPSVPASPDIYTPPPRLEDQVPFLISTHHFKRGEKHMVFSPDCEARCIACMVEESLQRMVLSNPTLEIPMFSAPKEISWEILSKVRRGIIPLVWTRQETLRDLQGMLGKGLKRIFCPTQGLN